MHCHSTILNPGLNISLYIHLQILPTDNKELLCWKQGLRTVLCVPKEDHAC